jgi:P-type Cu+ transporter
MVLILTTKQKKYILGNREWMRRNGVELSMGVERRMVREEELGRTAVLVAINHQLLAVLGIADTVKPEAHLTVYSLKQQGLDVVLLTGQQKLHCLCPLIVKSVF